MPILSVKEFLDTSKMLGSQEYQLRLDVNLINSIDALEAIRLLKDKGQKPGNPNKVYVWQDNIIPPNSPKVSKEQQQLAEFAKDYNVNYLYGAGMSTHLLLNNYVSSGQAVASMNRDIFQVGAKGVLGICLGANEFAAALSQGWIKIAKQRFFTVALQGTLAAGTDMRDAARNLLNILKNKVDNTTILVFRDCSHKLSLENKMILCCWMKKINVLSALFIENEGFDPEYVFSLASSKSSFAGKDNTDIRELPEQKVSAVFIGGVCGGFLKDIAMTAEAFETAKVAYGVRLTVAPATADIYTKAANHGYLTAIIEAGGLVINQCGTPQVQGKISPEEILVSNDIYNAPSYAGTDCGQIYLSSTAQAIKAALTGKVGGDNYAD